MSEFHPGMTHGEQLQLLVHTHFEPNRIVLARRKIKARIKAGAVQAVNEDKDDYEIRMLIFKRRKPRWEARLAEYELRLEEIRKVWTSAPPGLVEEAHAVIATLDAHGQPRGDN
ncbi:hypothetical protein LCGC14_1284000 [marine sediment metagenome]|uniref:Uncharacterized protein n=1 Tax=marine sediment metagenome TaxID=412755 RepID=A0A0F9NAZ0_9ZZZZ